MFDESIKTYVFRLLKTRKDNSINKVQHYHNFIQPDFCLNIFATYLLSNSLFRHLMLVFCLSVYQSVCLFVLLSVRSSVRSNVRPCVGLFVGLFV